jgi:hypothetical protein
MLRTVFSGLAANPLLMTFLATWFEGHFLVAPPNAHAAANVEPATEQRPKTPKPSRRHQRSERKRLRK